MPTPTYIPLATATLASASASVVLGSIPATYRDLVLIVNTPPIAGDQLVLRFNGDTGNNYSRQYMESIFGGTGAAAGTNDFAYVGAFGGDQASLIVNIMDYSVSGTQKSFLARGDAAIVTKATALRWANTAAITSVTVRLVSANLPIGTTINLYGIAA
jgi:hypothetical protein